MTTPRLIRFRFNDTQKPMDVISDSVVIVNPYGFRLSFHSVITSVHFHSSRFHDSGMPPQSQKKKCHTTDSFLMIYTYVYTHIYTLVNALNQKCFSCSFPFLCQSRRGTPGEQDKNREKYVRRKRKMKQKNKEKFDILL